VTASYFAASFFPDDVRADRQLLITSAAFTTTAGGRDFQGILRHETGHILGFRHEHIWITCTGEETSEARQVTSYDVNSVMHYPQCRPSGTGGYRQTSLDYVGATSLYGYADARAQRIRGDFNGDGREDVIIVTASGSFEYLGLAGGGFSGNAWVRTDLRLGSVAYVPGDFNGDGRTDLIIMTASGSFEYLGLAGGGFTGNAWVRTDLPLGSVNYVAGDFNGDGRSDLIIVTASGSFEYTGLAAGGFTGNVWVRTDLPRGSVHYLARDFTGDGRDDLIIVTASGSFEYLGLAAGGFTGNAWVRTDLPLGLVAYF
jgi:hypothetical protein